MHTNENFKIKIVFNALIEKSIMFVTFDHTLSDIY